MVGLKINIYFLHYLLLKHQYSVNIINEGTECRWIGMGYGE